MAQSPVAGLHASHETRNETLIRTIGVLAALAGGFYIIWRAGWTVNTDALWLSVPLLAAEVHGYLTYLGYFFITWNCTPLPQPRPFRGASVDFFIPTYNEPLAVLASTIAGALSVTYPHNTYVLDDGRRPWVRELCRKMGVTYRTRRGNKGAKAGNINAALARTRGEFVAVVDADFVPSPDYLDEMLGYFIDPRVALVQAPQEFYNLESFQHLRGDPDAWHEQAVFFRSIQPGKNHSNSAFWCGSPSVLRRAAIKSIGGVASETVTEDLETSIKLHSAGWKTVYHPGIVALGLAPNDYHGFIMQRLRWAEGTMQVIRKAWNTPNLTIAQRISYLCSTSTYFDALRKAVFLAVVPAVLLSDQLPITAGVLIFLPVWAAQFILGALANTLLGRGSHRPLMTEFFDTLKMFAFIRASSALITGHRASFVVTPKGQAGERQLHALLAPFGWLIGLYVVTCLVGLARVTGLGLDTGNQGAMFAALLWCFAILVFLTEVLIYGYTRVSVRSADRIAVQVSGTYRIEGESTEHLVTLSDLTTQGAAFHSPQPLARGTRLQIELDNGISFDGIVRRVHPVLDGYAIGILALASNDMQIEISRLIARQLFDATSAPAQVPVSSPAAAAA